MKSGGCGIRKLRDRRLFCQLRFPDKEVEEYEVGGASGELLAKQPPISPQMHRMRLGSHLGLGGNWRLTLARGRVISSGDPDPKFGVNGKHILSHNLGKLRILHHAGI